jgi:hypothetical protein
MPAISTVLVRIVFSSAFICIANALAPGLVSSLEPNGLSGVLLHYPHRGIAVERAATSRRPQRAPILSTTVSHEEAFGLPALFARRF